MSLADDVAINKYNLDEECLWQPQLFEKYAKLLVQAERERDFAKEKVELIQAETELKIRKKPLTYKLSEKPKESEIKSAITTQKEVRKAIEAYLEAVTNVKNLAVVVKRIDSHRKHSLNNLIALEGRGYFSKPTNFKKIKRVFENKDAKNQKQKQNELLQRTKRTKRTD